ncbi:MAG: hypothetical protein WC412_07060 [Candidatus Omnitrophota bacterium]
MKYIILALFFLLGCETVHKGAQAVGEPVGQAGKAVGGITEGAAQGYSDTQTENPYNR